MVPTFLRDRLQRRIPRLALLGLVLLGPAGFLFAQSVPSALTTGRSASLLPRDIREPFFSSAILHEDSTGTLVQYHNQAGCAGDADCYNYILAKVSPDLKREQLLTFDLKGREASSFFTVNQLGDRINVYFRDLNPETGRREYTATTYRADDFRRIGADVQVGSILVSKVGRYSGANFRTNDRTGQLATLLQDKSEIRDRHEPVRVSVLDSLHRQVWQQQIGSVGGREGIRVTDAALRDDGSIAALIEFSDSNDRYLLLLDAEGLKEFRIELDGTTGLQTWLEHGTGDTTSLYLFGKYYAGGAEARGLFLMAFDPTDLSLRHATRVPLADEPGLPGLRAATAGDPASGAAALRYFNHGRYFATPDGGGYLVGDYYEAGWKSTSTESYRQVRYGPVTVVRIDAGGRFRWARNLYRDINWREGLTIRERYGAHLTGNDLVVLFNHDHHGDPLTGQGLRSLTFLPDMESVAVRLTPDNAVQSRKLLPFELEKTILVPPVTTLSEDGTLLRAAIEKPLGFRKIYSFNLDW